MLYATIIIGILLVALYRQAAIPYLYLASLTAVLCVTALVGALGTAMATVAYPYTSSLMLSFGVDVSVREWITFLYLVAVCVLLFSTWYLGYDTRCMALLGLFTVGMSVLMQCGDLVAMFVGWECIGVASVLLVGVLSTRSTATRASMKAAVYNRLGDLALVLAVCIGISGGSTSLIVAQLCLDRYTLTLIGGLLVFSAVCKSSQLGLHQWLLDAMEGPTSVSTLLHSATLVLGGVVSLVKSYLYWFTTLGVCVAVWSACTVVYASCSAMLSLDVKRLTALSTVTHVGLVLLGLSVVGTAMVHSVAHSFVKAGVFALLGVVLHTIHVQDTRSYLPSYTTRYSAAHPSGLSVRHYRHPTRHTGSERNIYQAILRRVWKYKRWYPADVDWLYKRGMGSELEYLAAHIGDRKVWNMVTAEWDQLLDRREEWLKDSDAKGWIMGFERDLPSSLYYRGLYVDVPAAIKQALKSGRKS